MRNREKLIINIEDELDKIADSGFLNSTKLEQAYKLVDMLKDMRNIEYWEATEEAMGGYSGDDERVPYDRRASQYDRGSSYARRRDSMGRYSRAADAGAYQEYLGHKKDFRTTKGQDCKARMMDSLEGYLDEIVNMVEEISRDADCPEERAAIMRHVNQLRAI